MTTEDKIEAVKKIDKALGKKAVEPEIERVPPNKEHFDALMSAEQSKDTAQKRQVHETVEKTDKISSLSDQIKQLNTKVNSIAQLSPEDLKNQVRGIISQIEDVKSKLSEAGSIKPSYKDLMQNRITHVDDNIKVALSKAGVEYQDVAPVKAVADTQLAPIDRFLGLITQGQYKLEHLSETIGNMSAKGEHLTATDLLALQIKVGQIQQEIELFTSLLNKALESTKTLMNVQV